MRPLVTVALILLLVAATAAATFVSTRPAHLQTVPDTRALRVAVIGDSYSSGLNNTLIWPSLLAASSDFSVSNVAFPGSGYVGAVGESGPFADQAGKALASKPDVIVVFGGINDVGKSDDIIIQAGIDLFSNLSRGAPDAELIVLGPIWYLPELPESFYRLDAAIASAARVSHARYTSLIREQWLVGDGLIQSDQVNPNDSGQTVLARNLGPLLVKQIDERDTGVRG